MSDTRDCQTCDNTGWVCEQHPDKPWDGGSDKGCDCGGAGMPCGDCNTSNPPDQSRVIKTVICDLTGMNLQ